MVQILWEVESAEIGGGNNTHNIYTMHARKKEKYREHELEQFSSVGITEKSHIILKREKKKQEKSMMRLIDDLIKEKYE